MAYIALVGAGDQREPAVPWALCCELKGDYRQPRVHVSVPVDVILIGIELRAGRAVEHVALRTFFHGQELWLVVESEALPDNLIEVLRRAAAGDRWSVSQSIRQSGRQSRVQYCMYSRRGKSSDG